MPPAGERVNPVPLSGPELKRIILKDVEDVMSRDCVLSGVSAFGRVAYEVTLKLHFQNLSFPESSMKVVSRVPTEQEVAADPARVNVEGEPPLEEKGDSIPTETVAVERSREIDNPTQARVEHGLPVPIVKRNSEGRTEEATAKYPADSVPKGKVVDTNVKEETEREFTERKRKRKK